MLLNILSLISLACGCVPFFFFFFFSDVGLLAWAPIGPKHMVQCQHDTSKFLFSGANSSNFH